MTNPPSSRAERIARGLGAIALLLVAGALGFQYLAHLAPCEMCHWQRWPLIAAAITGLVILSFWKGDPRALAWFCVLLVAVSGLVGAYQTGMQWNLLPGPAACTAPRYVVGSGLADNVVRCDVVTWSLFGLSLAFYNAVISLGTAIMAAILLKKKNP